jgi:hypothetical protein
VKFSFCLLTPPPSRRLSLVPASMNVGRLVAATMGGGSRLGRNNMTKSRKTNGTTTTKTMVRACCETSSWTCNIHCVGQCRVWCRTNTGRRHLFPRPLSRMGWRRGGGTREERKEARWRTRWWQLRRGPSLLCRGIDGQMGCVWRSGPGHDPFNSAWASPSAVLGS